MELDRTKVIAIVVIAAVLIAGIFYYSSNKQNSDGGGGGEEAPVELKAKISIDRSTYSALVGETVNFSAYDSEGPIEYYLWDFGDGSTDSGPEVEHKYTSPGIYNVTLNVTDGRGHYAEDRVKMRIEEKGTGGSSVPQATLSCIYSSLILSPSYKITVVTIDPPTALANVTFVIMDNNTGEEKISGNVSELGPTTSPVSLVDSPALGQLSQGDTFIVTEDLGGGMKAEEGDLFVLYFKTGALIGFVQLTKV